MENKQGKINTRKTNTHKGITNTKGEGGNNRTRGKTNEGNKDKGNTIKRKTFEGKNQPNGRKKTKGKQTE